MNDAFDAMRCDHALDEIFIRGIANEQRHAFGQECGKAGGQVVDYDNAFAGFHQRMNHVTSDVAGAAGDKHGHEYTRLPAHDPPKHALGLDPGSAVWRKDHAPLFGGTMLPGGGEEWVSAPVNWRLCLILRIGNARNG